LRKDRDGFPDARDRAYRDPTASALAEVVAIEVTSRFEGLKTAASLLAASGRCLICLGSGNSPKNSGSS